MSRVLARSEVNLVNLNDIYEMGRDNYYSLWSKADNLGRHVKLYLHWTAGRYGMFFDDYHVQIDRDGSIYMPADIDFTDVLAGTYRRNSAGISISLLAAYNGNTNDLGPNPPTEAQVESMSRVIAAICDALDLTIDKKHVMTHGEAADNEDGEELHEYYGPKSTCERWDLEFLGCCGSETYNPYATDGTRGGDILRGKANWYRNYWEQNGFPYERAGE